MPDEGVNECESNDGVDVYHEAKIPPLVQKVTIDVDTVGLGEIFRYHLAYRRKVRCLFVAPILDILDFELRSFRLRSAAHCAHARIWKCSCALSRQSIG